MDTERKNRCLQLVRKSACILLLGAAYDLFIRLTGWALPCPFRLLTHKYCPGCGVTRMAAALLRFDFYGAFRSNILIVILLPFLAVWGIWRCIRYIRSGSTSPTKPETAFMLLAAIALIVFAVLRNTDAFSFMQPI